MEIQTEIRGNFKDVEIENKKSDTQIKGEAKLSVVVKHGIAGPVTTSEEDFCCGG